MVELNAELSMSMLIRNKLQNCPVADGHSHFQKLLLGWG